MIKDEYGQGSILYVKQRGKYRYAISDGVDENGKRRRIIHGNYDTREEAETALRQALKDRAINQAVLAEIESPVQRSKGHITIEAYLDKNLASFYPKAKSRTKLCYITTARYITAHIGDLYLDELTRLSLQTFISSQASLSSSMLSKIKMLLKKMTAVACLDGLIDKDMGYTLEAPASRQEDVRSEDEKVYSMEQLQEILMAARQERDSFLYTFLLLETVTGMRPEELRALYKTDIDYEHGRVSISKACTTEQAFDVHHAITADLPPRKTVLSSTKTASGRRKIPLSKVVLQVLKHWVRHLQKTDAVRYESKLLFPSSHGSVMRGDVLETKFRRFATRQGYDKSYTLYRFRHTFATNALENGINLKTLQRMMGHQSAEMLMQVYAHAPEKVQMAAGKKLSAVYDNSLLGMNIQVGETSTGDTNGDPDTAKAVKQSKGAEDERRGEEDLKAN